MSEKMLKLAATDKEDIVVLSALLQDAVVPANEMIYLAAEHRFAIVVYRFRWEDAGEERVPGAIYERICCGISFDKVNGVRCQNLSQSRRGEMLDLLALEASREWYRPLIIPSLPSNCMALPKHNRAQPCYCPSY